MTTISEMYAEECKQHAKTKRELRETQKERDAIFSAAESMAAHAGKHSGKLANALRILLASHECLAPDGSADIPEELSARFDIGLDDARQVFAALSPARESDVTK